jgi:uncharacterized protein (DUF58 family)
LLSADIIKKIKKIHIRTGRVVNTMMAGQYKSVFRGTGMEFEEVREYSPGDEVKNIDWKVSARMGRPYVKLYREERELVVMLLVDLSASGGFGTTETTKREMAAEVASILAFNAIRNNDKVGAILFTDQVEKYIPPQKGSAHVWRVIREVYTFTPERQKTDIAEAIAYLGRVCRKKTTSFIISDFIAADYIRQLKTVSKKHEIIGVLLSDPGEFILPAAGIFSVKDLETGRSAVFDAADKRTQRFFTERKMHAYDESLNTLQSADIDCIEVNTADPVVDALIKYFHFREKRKRR